MLRYNPLKSNNALGNSPIKSSAANIEPVKPVKMAKIAKPKEEWKTLIEWYDAGLLPIATATFKTKTVEVNGVEKTIKLYAKTQVEAIPTDAEGRRTALARCLGMERGVILPDVAKPAVANPEAPKVEPKKEEPDRLKEALRNQILRNKYAWVIINNVPDMLDVHPDFFDKVKSLGTVNGDSTITILFTFGERVIEYNNKQSVMNHDDFTLLSGDKQSLTRLVELVMDIYKRDAVDHLPNAEEPIRVINGKSYRPPKGMTWKQFDEKYGEKVKL